MSKFKVILIEHGYSSTQYEADIIEAAGGEFIDAENLTLEQKLALCEEADGMLVRRLQVTREVTQRLRRCKIVVRYGVGTDNVDLDAATDAGILVGHVPVYCSDEVSTHALGLLWAAVRHLVSTHKRLEQGAWDVNRADPVYRVSGKTLGLIGFGNIGQAVARKVSGWNLKVLAADPFVDRAKVEAAGASLVDLPTLCRESDYISLHLPLLPETHHLINKQTLGWMKPGAILVNTARGPIVSATDLIEALDAGRLACAALDVFEEEPLPLDSPLRRHPKVILTDHMAWYSEESQIDLQRAAAQEVVRACTGGLPIAIANPAVLHKLKRADEWKPAEFARWQFRRWNQLGVPLGWS